ncbi:hypothetical protein GUJ93_ZPchr0008g11598 [Zizania palustris]|uniref:Uncharacterized protein n=1 Tax=Zizania palustris TaxID=103762 RepID=A0A8J5R8J7_ZIZPA|nr:hypothetical protein GUJ93_ZPchr0008g11598 [Zizania palustris]
MPFVTSIVVVASIYRHHMQWRYVAIRHNDDTPFVVTNKERREGRGQIRHGEAMRKWCASKPSVAQPDASGTRLG